MIRKIRNSRGFTLVELMIVVAIVGILAALAIYGVRKYITNAKTAEARNSLGQMSKDASAAFSRENMPGATLNVGTTAALSNALCAAATNTVPAAAASIRGRKYQSSGADWNSGSQTAGWQCLKFSMQDPQYYMYNYTATGAGSAAGDTFTTVAQGDLNGDGVLSTFSLGGRIQTGAGSGLIITLAPNLTELNPDE